MQLMAEVEYSGIGRNKLQAAKLIGHFAQNAPTVMRAYVVLTVKVL